MLHSCLLLGICQYKLKYLSGLDHQNADALSRPPLPSLQDEPVSPVDALMIEAMYGSLLMALDIPEMTSLDYLLFAVYEAVRKGSTTVGIGSQFAPFMARQNKLSTHKGYTWGVNVVLPKSA